jgi:hypothetical protein
MSATKKLTGMGGDLQRLAALLQSKGRKGDTILAHINPREAALLKARGGSGTRNPATGLPEFFEPDFAYDSYVEPSSEPSYSQDSYPSVDPNVPAYQSPNADLGTQAGMIGGGNQGQDSVTMANAPAGYNFPSLGMGTGQGSPGSFASPLLNIPSPAQQARNLTPSTPSFNLQQALRTAAPFVGAGASAAVARNAANRAAGQGSQAQNQYRDLAAPYKSSAQALMSGQLTPANQQALDAARAQLAQGASARGGVGAEQAEAQVARLQQQLIENQYNMGLKIAAIGDAFAARGITAGLQADQQVTNLLSDVMRTIARAMGGSQDILGNENKPQTGSNTQNTGTTDVATEDTATTDGTTPTVGA